MTSEGTPQSPPPGWYPVDAYTERWWGGIAWGPETRLRPQAPRVAGPSRAVARVPVQTSHAFHLIMSLLTCGLWAIFVWLPITVINRMSKRKVVTKYR